MHIEYHSTKWHIHVTYLHEDEASQVGEGVCTFGISPR